MTHSAPMEILTHMPHPAVVFFHLPGIPISVGFPEVPIRSDLPPEAGEQQCFAGVHQVYPEGDALVQSEVFRNCRLHPRRSD